MPHSPSTKVQQRGVEATKQILESVVDGLELARQSVITVVELMPNRTHVLNYLCCFFRLSFSIAYYTLQAYLTAAAFRYNEWGRALLMLQKPKLQNPAGSGFDWRWISFATEEDCSLAEVEMKRKDTMGCLMAAATRACLQ